MITKNKFLQQVLQDFRKIPLIIGTIEVPRGDKKPYWDEPCFLDYGFFAAYQNPSDNDPLDIYYFNFNSKFTKGRKIMVKIFGLLTNDKGDIKLLATNPKKVKVKSTDIERLILRENVYNPGTRYISL